MRRIFDRSPFASILDADAELRQLGAIRIATGLLCLARIVPSIWASRYYFEEGSRGIPWVTVEGLRVVALILLVTAGVFTPSVRALYRLIGIPSTSGIRIILMPYFVAFGLINLDGAVNHWHEEAWRNGRAMDIISAARTCPASGGRGVRSICVSLNSQCGSRGFSR